MTTVLEQPTTTGAGTRLDQPMELRLFTVEEYDRMIEAGILGADERVELLEGRIIKMSPKGILHAAVNDHAGECFRKRLSNRVIVRIQNPIRLDTSEPEPDLVLAMPQEKRYFDHHPIPADILLVMEIADNSVSIDRNYKSRLSAAAGIIQYCIINLQTHELEDYRDPGPDGYRSKHTFRAEQTFSLVAFPETVIDVSELLPPA
ncbi:MAG TPA: Uma2 family endonuclease [Pyrinomonadaceae bacterium]|jgi:Uma2 family endonuclease|nr:Uma2 family endonuclease [Pyrinomonadaceae bacterium]